MQNTTERKKEHRAMLLRTCGCELALSFARIAATAQKKINFTVDN